ILQFDLCVNCSVETHTAKYPDLAKIYFMGFSENDKRIEQIENYLNELRKIHSQLEEICEDGEKVSAELQDNEIAFYQLQTAKYGRDFMKFNIDWYSRLLKNMRSN
ncbi:MAG: PadR family transcriptional regulator, partial [Clostridia bacterium]|nr:PadR family transcriptional regulator [Clostridia bacterium]